MPFPIALAVMAALTAAKTGVDAYANTRAERAGRRARNRQDENDEIQKQDARRQAITRALGVDSPVFARQLNDRVGAPDLGTANTWSGLLGLGSNMAALYSANAPAATPKGTDVPMPYKGQNFQSAYGPGSTIKPGSAYR